MLKHPIIRQTGLGLVKPESLVPADRPLRKTDAAIDFFIIREKKMGP